jgi:hypothetical protein
MSHPPRTLLAPGREAEWTQINQLEDAERRERAAALTVEQRVLEGVGLSRLAVEIKEAAASARGDGRGA